MFYILKHKTQDAYVGVCTTSNDGAEFCNSTTLELETFAEVPHLFLDKNDVDGIFDGRYQREWYSSSATYPMINDYIRKEIINNYEVVQLVIKD